MLNTYRTMPIVFPATTILLVAWYYDGTTLTYRVNSLVDGAGGYVFSESTTGVPSDWTTTYTATIGTVGKSLQLAELMAWRIALTASQRSAVDAYLRVKWGFPWTATPLPAVVSALPTRDGLVTFPTADANVIFAVGMRRILPGYGATAPILRIRRVNDNAEIDLIPGDEIG